VDRSRVTRWAAPVAFLAAITIGALVVRAGLESGHHNATHQQTTTTTSTTKKKHGHRGTQTVARMYTVQTGDTLSVIASKTGTTVAILLKLNPNIDPQALQVGQKIRVQ
jgi:LysM repeat protein